MTQTIYLRQASNHLSQQDLSDNCQSQDLKVKLWSLAYQTGHALIRDITKTQNTKHKFTWRKITTLFLSFSLLKKDMYLFLFLLHIFPSTHHEKINLTNREFSSVVGLSKNKTYIVVKCQNSIKCQERKWGLKHFSPITGSLPFSSN